MDMEMMLIRTTAKIYILIWAMIFIQLYILYPFLFCFRNEWDYSDSVFFLKERMVIYNTNPRSYWRPFCVHLIFGEIQIGILMLAASWLRSKFVNHQNLYNLAEVMVLPAQTLPTETPL